MNVRAVAALPRPTLHAIGWLPLAAGCATGLAVVLVPEALTAKLTGGGLTYLLRIAALCAALGAAFLLDDAASRSTPAVPTSRLARNLVRVAIAIPVIAGWWVATLALAHAVGHPATVAHLPVAALTLEAASLVAASLAIAAVAQRHTPDGNTGVAAAPAMLVIGAAVWFLPHRVALVVLPDDPQWTPAHRRWAAVLGLAVVFFLLAGRDRIRTGRPFVDDPRGA